MTKTPEARVKRRVVTQLDVLGAYYFYPVTGGYGRSGVPDIVGCYRGKFFGIECKAGKNKATALQLKNLQEIKENGGLALIIDESNADKVGEYLSHAAWDGEGDFAWGEE